MADALREKMKTAILEEFVRKRDELRSLPDDQADLLSFLLINYLFLKASGLQAGEQARGAINRCLMQNAIFPLQRKALRPADTVTEDFVEFWNQAARNPDWKERVLGKESGQDEKVILS